MDEHHKVRVHESSDHFLRWCCCVGVHFPNAILPIDPILRDVCFQTIIELAQQLVLFLNWERRLSFKACCYCELFVRQRLEVTLVAV